MLPAGEEGHPHTHSRQVVCGLTEEAARKVLEAAHDIGSWAARVVASIACCGWNPKFLSAAGGGKPGVIMSYMGSTKTIDTWYTFPTTLS